MKTIIDFCKKYNLEFREVKFKFQGFTVKRKGYDIYNPKTGYILITLEPVSHRDGSKWIIIDRSKANYKASLDYVKSITELNKITPDVLNFSGYMISK